jgi:hypothetical protein
MDIIAHARALLGVRFLHQGRDAEHGVDCLGLLLVVAEKAKLKFSGKHPMEIDVPNYRTKTDTNFLQAQLANFLQPISLSAVRPADIVLLEINGSPQHLALLSDYPVAGELGMIHAHAVARKVVEHRYDAQWRKVTRAAYRLPQLIEQHNQE